MSFQAYLDNIREKTGMGPAEFREAAAIRGLHGPGVKAGQVIAWLKTDYGLGPGHAMAIYSILKADFEPQLSVADRIAAQFAGAKAHWREPYDRLIAALGPDISVAPTDSYLSLLRGEKKFAVIAVTTHRLDVGIKFKGVEPTERLREAGNWNAMVTHRVQIHDPAGLDDELVSWLRDAYSRA